MIDISSDRLGSGIVIGKCYVIGEREFNISMDNIPANRVESEIAKFQNAVNYTSGKIRKTMHLNFSKIDDRLLQSQFLMLTDPEFELQVVSFIRETRQNAAQAILMAINTFSNKMKKIPDSYLSEREEDLQNVKNLLLSCLLKRNLYSDFPLSSESIIVASNILFSEVLTFTERGCIGFVLGNAAAHVYLALEASSVPSVINAEEIILGARVGNEIIVDGDKGRVILNPNSSLKEFYFAEKNKLAIKLDSSAALKSGIKTTDGMSVNLQANLMSSSDVEKALNVGALGVGLFRTEFSYLKNKDSRTEIGQYTEYIDLLKNMRGLPVTIRTLDLGGEKNLIEESVAEDSNPLLGIRGIRYTHANIDLFKSHLKALVRASVFGNLRIMFPFISCLEELQLSLSILKDVQDEYDLKKIKYRKVPIGIMVELPSVATCIDLYSPYIDFIALGTNDLFQYLTAVDRSNNDLTYLKKPVQPALLRILFKVVSEARFYRIPVSVCGELANEPNMMGLLLGIGITNFSMNPVHIPQAQKTIRRLSNVACRRLADSVSELSSQEQISQKIINWNYNHVR